MFILQQIAHELPEHLVPRNTPESVVVLVLFVACLLLTAIASSAERQVFPVMIQAVFFLRPLDDLYRDSYKTSSLSSVLFIAQFLLMTAGAVYWLFFLRTPLENLPQLLVPLFMPAIYFVYQFVVTNVAARIGGEAEIMAQLNYFSLLLTQFFGIVFFAELFISYFQPSLIEKSEWLLGMTYLAYLAIRFLRGFWIVAQNGVPWYYIILYFWTLEILPLLIVARLLYYKEFQAWIG